MNKIAKKEIRQSIEEAIATVLLKFNISTSPKKMEKRSKTFSKKFAEELKDFLKKKPTKGSKVKKTTRKIAKKTTGKGQQA